MALLAATVVIAGCGGGTAGVANVGASSTSTTTSPSSSGSHPTALGFAVCMRAHGIGDFPDPNGSGTIDLKSLHPGPGSDLDPSSAPFRAAHKACAALQPPTFSPGSDSLSAAQQRRAVAGALKFSECMRTHGDPGFPDPASDGRLSVHSIRSAGLAPASPLLRSAVRACGRYLPGNIQISRPPGAGA